MRRQWVVVIVAVLVSLLVASPIMKAQEPPQNAGFVYIGEIYREKQQTPACCDAADLLLPEHFKLDRSYHQQSIQCCGGGATSNISPADIPAGIHLSVSGGYYWALPKAPVLLVEKVDDDDKVTQWRFRTPLYCGP